MFKRLEVIRQDKRGHILTIGNFMGNLGKVKVWATVGGPMPNMDFTTEESVQDLPASDAHTAYMNRADGDPLYIEFIEDPMTGGFMVIPQRRYRQIANYMNGVSSSTTLASPRITWNVLEKARDNDDLETCVGNEPYLIRLITNTDQEMIAPNSASGSVVYPDSYSGPRWSNPRISREINPVDETDTEEDTTEAETETVASSDDFSTSVISQDQSCQDVWWSIQTTSLSSSEMKCVPFYIDVTFQKPLVHEQPTFLVLRLGNIAKAVAAKNSDIIDLVFVQGQPPMLYDRGLIKTKINKDKTTEHYPASITLNGNIAWDGQLHRIGILPLAGRLCISVDGQDTLYTRIDAEAAESSDSVSETGLTEDDTDKSNPAVSKGTILFFPSYNQIRLIGSNSKAIVSLAATVFPALACLPTSMPGGFNEKTNASDTPLSGSTSGIADGASLSSMVELPNQDEKPILGAFARYCGDYELEGGDTWGEISKEYMYGKLDMELEKDQVANPTANLPIGKHYVIYFTTEFRLFGEGVDEKRYIRMGFPIWFRARGVTKVANEVPEGQTKINIGADIMELTESFTSPDRYHVTHSVDIVLYNEYGEYDELLGKSLPIQLGYSWSNSPGSYGDGGPMDTTVFTGVTLNSSTTLIAGKETMSIHCEDYMFLLGATQIINSPYFDGMDGFNVVKSLANKAHVICIDDTGGKAGERFFLPSGYSFLEPVKRYDGKMAVKDGILDVCSMAPKVVYFDGDGILHYSHIQGGIGFVEANDAPTTAEYFSDPAIATDKNMILDQKQIEVKINSVVNNIYCRTVDRSTRTIIMVNDKANTSEDILSYKKIIYILIPSLGSYKAATNYIERLKPIVYKPIKSVTIKTADDTPIIPMNYMEVDGKKYRIMALNRTINISDNSITSSITGEWMGAHVETKAKE